MQKAAIEISKYTDRKTSRLICDIQGFVRKTSVSPKAVVQFKSEVGMD